MKKTVLLIATHAAMLAAGFALGVYFLPILAAPPPLSQAQLDAAAAGAAWRASFRRDLPGSDALHWGEGAVTVSTTHVAHQGRLAPGPAYRLYLTPRFVDTGDAFLQVKAQSVALGDVKSFDGFIVPVPAGVDLARYQGVLIWCEAFQRFITSASYR
ncbi:MAG: DM13 domain-containing protein [Ramlibacter sp.]